MQNQKFKQYDCQCKAWKDKSELVYYKGNVDELLFALFDECCGKHQTDHTIRKERKQKQYDGFCLQSFVVALELLQSPESVCEENTRHYNYHLHRLL